MRKSESARPWAAFPDHWALLNASEEDVRAAARADTYPAPDGWPEAEIAEVVEVLALCRALYEHAATSPPETAFEYFGAAYDYATGRVSERPKEPVALLWQDAKIENRNLAVVAAQLTAAMDRHGLRGQEELRVNAGGVCGFVSRHSTETSIFQRLRRFLWQLWSGLMSGASSATVFQCHGCDRLLPRRDKRLLYCSDTCRKRVRRGSKKRTRRS